MYFLIPIPLWAQFITINKGFYLTTVWYILVFIFVQYYISKNYDFINLFIMKSGNSQNDAGIDKHRFLSLFILDSLKSKIINI